MKAGIVGAGILGRLLALALLSEGWQVSLFEQNNSDNSLPSCSDAAAGLLTPFSELDKADWIIAQLGAEALKNHWLVILQALDEPIYFQHQGSLVLSHPNDQAEWKSFRQRVLSKKPQQQIYHLLTQSHLAELESDLSHFEQAYYFPDEGQIDSQQLLKALETHLCQHGINWHTNTRVSSVDPGKITVGSMTESFDMVFDSRGLGAKSIFSDLRGVRGELIWLHAPEVTLRRPIRFLHPRYSLYIAPRPNHMYLIGASEIEAEDQSPISVRTTLELLTAAYSVHPGFAEARIIKTVTHCRPTLTHHLPRIQFTDGLIAVNGLYRHGYLIAPTLVAEIMSELKSNSTASSPRSTPYRSLWENYYAKN